MDRHNDYMRIALQLAESAVEKGNEPFGAILVKEGEVVAKSENSIVNMSDPTKHAELKLISDYTQLSKNIDLSEYTMYTSCEPCFMCSGATVWANLGTLVYSAGSRDLNEMINENLFDSSDIVYEYSHHKPVVIKNVLHDEGVEILRSYFVK